MGRFVDCLEVFEWVSWGFCSFGMAAFSGGMCSCVCVDFVVVVLVSVFVLVLICGNFRFGVLVCTY